MMDLDYPRYEASSHPPLSLSGLVTLVGNAVRTQPRLQGVWVIAELSDVRSSGGHYYMELIEKDGRGATVAKLRANLWAGTAAKMRQKFFRATGRDIMTGIKVMLCGSVTHHNIYGLSFNIQDIDPSYTLGDLERLRREILETLHREGVLENNRRLPFPVVPQKIAVISAPGAAGYGDFTDQLAGSEEGFVFYPLLFGAVMQGERTPASVMDALDSIEMSIDFWDAVVIIRGGGSTSDLNGFDNLELARRVATFPIPVIVGIGHERDRTVLDDIACVRCKTPTAVAAFLIDRMREALASAETLADRIARYTSDRIEGDRRRLETVASLIPTLTARALTSAHLKIQRIAAALPVGVGRRTASEQSCLATLDSSLRLSLVNFLGKEDKRLEDISSAIKNNAARPIPKENDRLEHLRQMIEVLSPMGTLKRGYSITRIGGKIVTDPSSILPGTAIETTLVGGKIVSHT